MTQRTRTIIIGAGQAGLALSQLLAGNGHDHLVLERGRIGERWRTRWDSLTLLTPNWQSRLPGFRYEGREPDGFMARDEVVSFFEAYARSFEAPVVESAEVRSVRRQGAGFVVEASVGTFLTENVVVATGHCAEPLVPALAGTIDPTVQQLHSNEYRNPGQLVTGPVLVVGAGASGQQIAAELARHGRDVLLAVGRHARVLRTYRGRDICYWLDLAGYFDRGIDEMPDPRASRSGPSLALTGHSGGEQLDLGTLAAMGVAVTGRLDAVVGVKAHFATSDLPTRVAEAEARLQDTLASIDQFIAASPEHADAPARDQVEPVDLPAAPPTASLGSGGIAAVIWATGYRRSYHWLEMPVLDAAGEIQQRHGVTPVEGLYTLGIRFQSRRKSSFIDGVGDDARDIARYILRRSDEEPRELPTTLAEAG